MMGELLKTRCPRCFSLSVRRSHRRWWERVWHPMTARRPFRCAACEWRGWLNGAAGFWNGRVA